MSIANTDLHLVNNTGDCCCHVYAQVLYGQIQQERAAQGYWLTNLELAVQQRPPEEAQWTMVGHDHLAA